MAPVQQISFFCHKGTKNNNKYFKSYLEIYLVIFQQPHEITFQHGHLDLQTPTSDIQVIRLIQKLLPIPQLIPRHVLGNPQINLNLKGTVYSAAAFYGYHFFAVVVCHFPSFVGNKLHQLLGFQQQKKLQWQVLKLRKFKQYICCF